MVRLPFALLLCLFTIVSLTSFTASQGQDWARFRGPNGTGIGQDLELPVQWAESDYSWRTKLAGTGTSSPVVWGDKVFVTSCDPKTPTLFVQCFKVDSGVEIWKREFSLRAHRQHRLNSYAASTPAVDAKHVYISMADPEHTILLALDHQGADVWKRDFGSWVSAHGFSVSPMIYEDKVIFVNSQQTLQLRPGVSPGESHILAVKSSDGSDAWKAKLTATRTCYAVPCVLKSAGKPDQLIGANTGDGFYSINPLDGTKNWSAELIKQRTVASPFIAAGLIFASSGSGGGGNELVAIRPPSDVDPLVKIEPAYTVSKSANYVPTPIAVNDLLFLFGDKGIATCIDIKSGKVHFRERLSKGFSGSPVASGERIYVGDQEGNVFVIAAKREFKLLGSSYLGEPGTATPAIAAGRIFFRTDGHLMALVGADK